MSGSHGEHSSADDALSPQFKKTSCHPGMAGGFDDTFKKLRLISDNGGATVDNQGLSGNHSGRVTGQEGNGICDVLRITELL